MWRRGRDSPCTIAGFRNRQPGESTPRNLTAWMFVRGWVIASIRFSYKFGTCVPLFSCELGPPAQQSTILICLNSLKVAVHLCATCLAVFYLFKSLSPSRNLSPFFNHLQLNVPKAFSIGIPQAYIATSLRLSKAGRKVNESINATRTMVVKR